MFVCMAEKEYMVLLADSLPGKVLFTAVPVALARSPTLYVVQVCNQSTYLLFALFLP